MSHIVVFVTASSEDEAAKIAKAVVGEGLAACANIIKGVRSIYSWQGKMEDEQEVLMVIKTRQGLFESLMDRVKKLHSYAVPEVIALPIVEGSEDYLNWIDEITGQIRSS